MDRLLFILKHRESDWGSYGYAAPSSGLRNSVAFLADMLRNRLGIDARVVEVADNDEIDRAVTLHRPSHVIVEAYWVVPEKFDELIALHPEMRWIVRNHSEMPFLANEGIAFGWTAEYLRRGIEVMCNAPRALADLRAVALACGQQDRMVTFGPNVYPIEEAGAVLPHLDRGAPVVDIGCFGAIRPLKNHMLQAVAALAFARRVRRRLRFHVNAARVEGNGDPVLKNLRGLFAAAPGHELVEHGWLPHEGFTALLGGIGIAMQVSFSETFNIVAADAAAASVPVVVSPEVPWLHAYAHADPTSAASMTAALLRIWEAPDVEPRLHRQRRDLLAYCMAAERVWCGHFGGGSASAHTAFLPRGAMLPLEL